MASNRPPSLAVGTRVNDRYMITAVVGQGGLGTVYQVQENRFGQSNTYALKETSDLSEGAREQFEREARWLERLDHPHIPRVRQYFEWQERLYLVMDFVAGENLEHKLFHNTNTHGLPESDVLRWLRPITNALGYLHTQNPPIIHRDVKPANIIVTTNGQPALVDLGIAKEHMPGMPNITATFIRKAGTEGYAPPEQYASNGTTGPWSDIYSLGATMYHLLTGHVPASAIERAALDNQLIAPRALNPALSAAMEAVIMRALAIRPSERYSTMHELEQELLLVEKNAKARPITAPTVPQYFCPRCKRPMLAAAPMCEVCARELVALSGPLQGSHLSGPYRPTPPSPAVMQQNPVMPSIAPNSSGHSRRNSARAIERSKGASVATPVSPMQSTLNSAPLVTPLPAYNSIPRRSSTTQTPPGGAVGVPKTRDARHYLWQILAVVIGVALLGFGILLGTHVITLGNGSDTSSPQVAATGYFNSLKNHDYQHAYGYFAPPYTSSMTYEQFAATQSGDTASIGDITGFTIADPTIVSVDKEKVTAQVVRGKTTLTYTLELVDTAGKWLIDSVN